MTAIVNGKQMEFSEGATLTDAVDASGHQGGSFGIAVALNGEVVARSRWETTTLADGDKIEVLVAAQGG